MIGGGILGAKNVGSPEMSGLKNKYSSVVKYEQMEALTAATTPDHGYLKRCRDKMRSGLDRC